MTRAVADKLEEAINSELDNSSSSNNGMNTGNLNESIEAIDQISKVHEMFKESPSVDEVKVNTDLFQR